MGKKENSKGSKRKVGRIVRRDSIKVRDWQLVKYEYSFPEEDEYLAERERLIIQADNNSNI